MYSNNNNSNGLFGNQVFVVIMQHTGPTFTSPFLISPDDTFYCCTFVYTKRTPMQ